MFILISIIIVASAFVDSVESGIYFSVIFIAISILLFRNAFLSYKHWKENGEKFIFEVLPDRLIASDAAGDEITRTESIEKLTIQSSRAGVKSIIISVVSGREGKLEGLENMEKLSNELQKIVVKNKIVHRRYLHR